MKLLHPFIIFFKWLAAVVTSPKYIVSTGMDFLNASEVLFIHHIVDSKSGFIYMHIHFASHHKLSIQFRTREEYEEALKKITG